MIVIGLILFCVDIVPFKVSFFGFYRNRFYINQAGIIYGKRIQRETRLLGLVVPLAQ